MHYSEFSERIAAESECYLTLSCIHKISAVLNIEYFNVLNGIMVGYK